jgi:poly-gamma-glutamate capsule biosynthesis protein CapA/YwtB (metallophosphatase superfamily)
MKLVFKIFIALLLVLIVFMASILIFGQQKTKTEVYQQKPSQIKEEVEKPTEISFLAMGDIMLSRNVAGQISKNNQDANWPFAKLATLLKQSNFNFANLESPFSGTNDYPTTGSLVFNAPMWTLPGLIDNNFKVLNLANNHAYDQSQAGLLNTKRLLESSEIISLGAGKDLNEAWEGRVYEINGIKIGFIGASYASVNDGGVIKNNNVARIEDTARLKQSIATLKTKADFIVVTMHAGTEYMRKPNQGQIDFAHSAIDSGADIVIGAHPHWIQTTEVYEGKPIFYSLGNFVFDQMFSQDTKEGLMLDINLEKSEQLTSLKQIKLLPVIIENYGQPRLANPTEQQSILQKINLTSDIFEL